MQRSPLLDESEGCPWDLTADRRPVIDANQRFVFGVYRVEVRRIVIGEVHIDDDSVELAKPRHANNLQRNIQGPLVLAHGDGRPSTRLLVRDNLHKGYPFRYSRACMLW
jgi:hypothetical protein